eukprot:jgi/Botrbrau1/183/Bobra.0022s0163.1
MEWETSKENYQPVKQGRDPNVLNTTKDEITVKTNRALIEQERRRFHEELETYDGPDPLAIWLRFIKWTQDTFKAGGHQAEMLLVLERCTRELQRIDAYKKDVRYLRVWIQYADCLPEPRDVFQFLQDQGIGQDFALFYIAFATYLELKGNFARADAVYQLGLQRMAYPVDRLRAKYQELQNRMVRRMERQAMEGVSGGQEAQQDENAAVRTALQRLHTRPRSGIPGSAAAMPPTGLSRMKRKGVSALRASSDENGLDIYVDDEFRNGQRNAPEDPFGVKRQEEYAQPGWSHLPTFEQTRKENVQAPCPWAGKTIKQKRVLLPSAVPALDIPEDEDLVDHQPQAPPRRRPSRTLRQRLEVASDQHADEELQIDPLHFHKAPNPPKPCGREVLASKQKDAAHKQAKREEQQAYNAIFAGESGADDISFEEVRAVPWLVTLPVTGVSTMPTECEMDIDVPAIGVQAAAEDDPTGHALQQAVEVLTAESGSIGSRILLSPVIHTSASPVDPFHSAAPFTSCSSVRATDRSANPLPLALENVQAPGVGSTLSPTVEDPTLATRGAFGATNRMLSISSSPNDPPVSVHADVLKKLTSEAQHRPQIGPKQLSGVETCLHVRDTYSDPSALMVSGKDFTAVKPIFPDASANLSQTEPRMPMVNNPSTEPFDQGFCLLGNAPIQPESDVTMATQEAFAAINSMFVDPEQVSRSSLTSSSQPKPTSAFESRLSSSIPISGTEGRGGVTGALFQRDITLSTRDAFDTINAMFSGALLEDVPWRSSFQPLQQSPQDTGALPDPTVTMATQAAFDVINGMMAPGQASHGPPPQSSPSIVTPPRRAPPPKVPPPAGICHSVKPLQALYSIRGTAGGPITSREPPLKLRRIEGRQSSAGSPPSTKPFPIYGSDTLGSAGMERSPEGQFCEQPLQVSSPDPLSVYEDTQLLDGHCGFGSAAMGLQDTGPHASSLYQDTQMLGIISDNVLFCLPQHQGSPQAGPGVSRDDATEFMSENLCATRLARQPPGRSRPMSSNNHEGASNGLLGGLPDVPDTQFTGVSEPLGVYEDTQLLTQPMMKHQKGTASSEPMGVYEDTQFLDEKAGSPSIRCSDGFCSPRLRGPVAVFDDSQMMLANMSPAQWGLNPVGVYEDTQLMTENVVPTCGAINLLKGSESALLTSGNSVPPRCKNISVESTQLKSLSKSVPMLHAKLSESRHVLRPIVKSSTKFTAGLELGSTESSPSSGSDLENRPPGPTHQIAKGNTMSTAEMDARALQEIDSVRMAALDIKGGPQRRLFSER